MTFSEKLIRLRKREGLSQEALAEILGVSRQAVSRWEQGTALPDGGKLLPCARHFGVSVDWLLDEKQGWENLAGTGSAPVEGESPVICKNWHWYLSGGIVTGVGVLGMVVMGILSSLFPVVLTEAPAGVEWTRVYTGLMAFLKGNDVEWLFALWAAVALVGFWLLAQPSLRQRQERPGSLGSPRYAAGIAAAAYGCGQTAWWVQQGKNGDIALLALFLAAAIFCVVRLLLKLGQEPTGRRRQERLIALLYTAAQGVILLLTAEAGIGLVGLVLHVGVCLFYVQWEDPQCMDHRFFRR